MEAKINQFFESVTNFFGGGDHIPWSTPDVILVSWPYIYDGNYRLKICSSKIRNDGESFRALATCVGCESEVAEANKDKSDERINESIMRLSWALIHSRKPEDVQRGIAMLEASLTNTNSPLQNKEKLYLLAVGYYRSGDFSRSRQLVDQCLEIAPAWRQALSLKKAVEERVTKDGVIGIGITATAVGLIAGGIAAALARKG